jgi:hypothetical protein
MVVLPQPQRAVRMQYAVYSIRRMFVSIIELDDE